MIIQSLNIIDVFDYPSGCLSKCHPTHRVKLATAYLSQVCCPRYALALDLIEWTFEATRHLSQPNGGRFTRFLDCEGTDIVCYCGSKILGNRWIERFLPPYVLLKWIGIHFGCHMFQRFQSNGFYWITLPQKNNEYIVYTAIDHQIYSQIQTQYLKKGQ